MSTSAFTARSARPLDGPSCAVDYLASSTVAYQVYRPAQGYVPAVTEK
jgi:hypothetical protein